MASQMGSDPIHDPAQPLDTAGLWGLTPTLPNRRAVAIGEILLCSSVPTQVLIGTVLRAGGLSPIEPNGQLSLPFVLVLSIVDTALLIALMVMLTRSHGQSVRGLWLDNRPVRGEILHGLMLVPLVFVM